jgi:pantetheine-phosphate adenylyltransferase
VAKSESKQPLFTLEERLAFICKSVSGMPNVEADAFDCLLVDYVRQKSAEVVLRGLRAVSDFEFELQMALMNRSLNENFETIFMMPKARYSFLSSRVVKEIAHLRGDVGTFVPEHVRSALQAKIRKPQA